MHDCGVVDLIFRFCGGSGTAERCKVHHRFECERHIARYFHEQPWPINVLEIEGEQNLVNRFRLRGFQLIDELSRASKSNPIFNDIGSAPPKGG